MAASLGQWLTEISAKQPPEIETDVWRRACALKTVNAGCPVELGQVLLAGVLDDALVNVNRFYAFDPFGNRIEFIQVGDGFSEAL